MSSLSGLVAKLLVREGQEALNSALAVNLDEVVLARHVGVLAPHVRVLSRA